MNTLMNHSHMDVKTLAHVFRAIWTPEADPINEERDVAQTIPKTKSIRQSLARLEKEASELEAVATGHKVLKSIISDIAGHMR